MRPCAAISRPLRRTQGDASTHFAQAFFSWMLRRYKDSLIVNPGSVGLALDRVSPLNEVRNPPWGEYAIIEAEGNKLTVELHRIPFDIQAFIQTIHTSGMPHADWLANEWNVSQP